MSLLAIDYMLVFKKEGDMNHLIRFLFAIVLIGVFTSSCQSKSENPINNVVVDAALDLVTKDETVIVLDVRTPKEYVTGHIEGALNINIAETDFSERVSKLDRDKTYIVHCSANVENGRSAKSLEIMSSLGFEKLLNMEVDLQQKTGQIVKLLFYKHYSFYQKLPEYNTQEPSAFFYDYTRLL